MERSSSTSSPGPIPRPDTPKRGLFTIRLITLLDLLRRSATLANRREFSLTDIEWRIMGQVGEHAPLSLNDLAELMRLDRGQLSRAVKAMVERGLVSSRRRPGGPAIVITLTEEGEGLYVRMMSLAVKRNQFLIGDIPPDEIDRVSEVIEAVTRKAQALLESERTLAVRQAGGTD